MVYLENERYRVIIAPLGAEIQSFYDKEKQMEYMWQADPEYWGRHAPILFPIVGALKGDQYEFAGQSYQLPRHGFARDEAFVVVAESATTVSLRLTENARTLSHYPFAFELVIQYQLEENCLSVHYQVKNPNSTPLYFSIGAHPAFRVPLNPELSFEAYHLTATPLKSRTMLPLKDTLIDYTHRTLGQTNAPLALTHALFSEDALVFESKGYNEWTIASDQSSEAVTLAYEGFPYVGIWSTAPKQSAFVCIEPWYGVADTLDTTGELTTKLGIQTLAAHAVFDASYKITVNA